MASDLTKVDYISLIKVVCQTYIFQLRRMFWHIQ